MSEHYGGHDPEAGCGVLMLAAVLVVVALALGAVLAAWALGR